MSLENQIVASPFSYLQIHYHIVG